MDTARRFVEPFSRLGSVFLPPIPRPLALDLESRQQGLQLGRRHFGVSVHAPGKGPALQPFGAQPQARPVPGEGLDPGVRTVTENKDMPGEHILLQLRLYQRVEPVKSQPEIRGPCTQENARRAR